MQSPESYLPQNRHALTQSPESLPTEAKAITQTATRTLWVRMAEIYGHRWNTAYGSDPDPEGAAGTWAKGLAGVTPAQLADGLKACITSSDPWPPTLPEFRAMCLGIPSLVSVRAEVNGKGDRTPFAMLVWQRLDSYQYRQVSAKDAERMLAGAYEDAREFVMRGGALPEVVGAVSHEEKPFVPVSPDVAEKHMLNLRRELYGADYITKADEAF